MQIIFPSDPNLLIPLMQNNMPTTPQSPASTRMIGPNTFPPTPDSTNYNSLKRKLNVDPTYSPTLDHRTKGTLTEDAYGEEQVLRGTVLERTGRKVRIVDPTYNPKHEVEDTDDEATKNEDPRKRKRVSGNGVNVTDKESAANRAKGNTNDQSHTNEAQGRAKGPLRSKQRSLQREDYAVSNKKHAGPKKPAMPRSLGKQIETSLSPEIYPTSASLDGNLIHKSRSLLETVFPAPRAPSWNASEPSTPSWDAPKANMRAKGGSKPQEDEIYLPSRRTVHRQPFKQHSSPKRNGAEDWMSDEEEEYIEIVGVSKNEKDNIVFDFSLEKAKRLAAAVSLPDTWSKAEKELFSRLAMRGFEPLLPRHWQHDFSTLPQSLFPILESGQYPLIRPYRDSDFYAIKSLAGLFALGGRVRDCSILQTRPEIKVKQAIKKYIGWALHDADLHEKSGAIPVYTIHSQKKGESIVAAVARLNRRLETLCKRYHEVLGVSSLEQLRTPHQKFQSSNASITIKEEPEDNSSDQFEHYFPLLIGFVICGPIVAILTLDTDPLSPKDWAGGDAGSKFISQFDVGERGQEVWTSLAVAITTMHIRQTMVRLAENGEGGFCRSLGDMSYASDEDL